MSSRQFTDSKGVQWRVWSTIPSPASLLSADYAGGWITFDSRSERRRLAPIPRGWEEASDKRLELMCRAASEVTLHTGPIPRLSRDSVGIEALPPDEAAEPPSGEPERPPVA